MKFDLTFLTNNDANKQEFDQKVATEMSNQVSLFDLALPTVANAGSPNSQQQHELTFPPPPPSSGLGESVGSTRSASIPLPSSHIERTQSEIQLDLDEAAAEQREITMFYRMVNGIRERQRQLSAAQPPNYHANTGFIATPHPQDFPALVPQEPAATNCWCPNNTTSNYVSDDGWSITGYDATEARPPRPEQEDSYGEDDQGIFDIEL